MCHAIKDDFRLLPCLHSFCTSCLLHAAAMPAIGGQNHTEVACAECKVGGAPWLRWGGVGAGATSYSCKLHEHYVWGWHEFVWCAVERGVEDVYRSSPRVSVLLLDAPTALAACCGFDLCHKYILYLYLHLYSLTTARPAV
jgi:hypothetical protein